MLRRLQTWSFIDSYVAHVCLMTRAQASRWRDYAPLGATPWRIDQQVPLDLNEVDCQKASMKGECGWCEHVSLTLERSPTALWPNGRILIIIILWLLGLTGRPRGSPGTSRAGRARTCCPPPWTRVSARRSAPEGRNANSALVVSM
jgi:hypothetical protein